jgi:protocatechuate 3,4-dioxygenase beta subunit
MGGNPGHTDDDDAPVGRVLTRREALALLGGAGAGGLLFLAGCGGADEATGAAVDTTAGGTASLSCAAKPALTEGPYFVDERLNRSDIRASTATGVVKDGALFALTFNIRRIRASGCTALAGAFVDIWQCDALGVYSDAVDPGFNTRGQNWLRGYQTTDANGLARFTTIFPGWYQGRATHIHFKVRQTLTASSANEFTSQLFFPEDFLTALYTSQAPYTTKGDAGRLRNARDGIFGQGGSQLLVTPTRTATGGYEATVNIGLSL